MKFKILKILSLCILLTSGGNASAAMIYASDTNGNVGYWDSVTNTGGNLGNLSTQGFAISQVVGAAWDSVSNSVILLDRTARNVYSMDSTTGIGTLLFSANSTFQGGAVKNGLLYGINENTQVMEAYNLLTGTQVILSNPMNVNHAHGVAINALTGQLYVGSTQGIFAMNDDGSIASQILNINNWAEDLEYFNGDFLEARGGSIQIKDGNTGALSSYLGSSEFSTMGLSSGVFSVTVAQAISSVPEPSTLAILLLGLMGIYTFRKRPVRN